MDLNNFQMPDEIIVHQHDWMELLPLGRRRTARDEPLVPLLNNRRRRQTSTRHLHIWLRRQGVSFMHFGFSAGLLAIILLIFLLTRRPYNPETSILLACKVTSLSYVQREISTSNLTCSTPAFSKAPIPQTAQFCDGLGVNKTCYSQEVFYQREKHLVEMSMELGGTIVNNDVSCSDMIRTYWYVCDNAKSSVEDNSKLLKHLPKSVVMTTIKVFTGHDDQQKNENELENGNSSEPGNTGEQSVPIPVPGNDTAPQNQLENGNQSKPGNIGGQSVPIPVPGNDTATQALLENGDDNDTKQNKI